MTVVTNGREKIDITFAKPPSNYMDLSPEPFLPSFDDIPEWVTTYFQGRVWLVRDKGENLSTHDGRHLELWAMDNKDPSVFIIHEDMVNGWLKNRVVIHFNWWDTQ